MWRRRSAERSAERDRRKASACPRRRHAGAARRGGNSCVRLASPYPVVPFVALRARNSARIRSRRREGGSTRRSRMGRPWWWSLVTAQSAIRRAHPPTVVSRGAEVRDRVDLVTGDLQVPWARFQRRPRAWIGRGRRAGGSAVASEARARAPAWGKKKWGGGRGDRERGDEEERGERRERTEERGERDGGSGTERPENGGWTGRRGASSSCYRSSSSGARNGSSGVGLRVRTKRGRESEGELGAGPGPGVGRVPATHRVFSHKLQARLLAVRGASPGAPRRSRVAVERHIATGTWHRSKTLRLLSRPRMPKNAAMAPRSGPPPPTSPSASAASHDVFAPSPAARENEMTTAMRSVSTRCQCRISLRRTRSK